MKPEVDFPTFMIVGMSRSGTKWLCRCLNTHPEIAAFGESKFFARAYIAPEKDGRYSKSQLQTVIDGLAARKWTTTIGDEEGCLKQIDHKVQKSIVHYVFSVLPDSPTPGQVFERVAHEVASKEGKRVAVEKTPQHLLYYRLIKSELPRVKFLVLLRDPYEFLLSYKHQGDRRAEEQKRAFDRLYHPLSASLIWRGYLRSANGLLKEYPDDALVIRSNRLFTDSEGVLLEIQEFFGLSPLARALPKANSSFTGERPQLQPEDYFWMNLVAGKEIRRFRGNVERKGKSLWRVVVSAARLPVWAVRNFLAMKALTPGGLVRYVRHWASR